MTVTDDYTEADRWDWDQNDRSQHCQHGTFIGSWWGPDIMCGWCEDGISVEEMRTIQAESKQRLIEKHNDSIAGVLDAVYAVFDGLPYRADVATAMTSYVLAEARA